MPDNRPRIGFISLGCPKNLVDSERILTQLRYEGYALSPDYEASDLVVINTCGFIESAVDESLETIGEALESNGKVVVTGCLGSRAEEIRQRYPELLAISGAHAYEEVMGAIHQHLPMTGASQPQAAGEVGVKLTPRHYAYLKIAEGCSHRCSFCIIPQLRGDLVSRPLDEVLREAENLAQSGVRELLVISQDTAAYGQDIRHRTAFWQGKPLRSDLLALARELSALGIWIRLHYLYPYKSLDALVEMMAEGALLPYLDMPLQHSSPQVLRAMRRPAASEAMLDRIRGWRSRCPELTLRSTFIVGFPGEREADFEGLLEFVEEAQIDRGGCFAYSDIAGAASRALPDQVPEEVKEERQQRLMERLAHISRQRLCQRIGKLETVLIDEVHNDHVIARSAGDAPEIDGVVVIDGAWEVDPGDFVEVEISAADDHDLHARMIGCEEDEA